MEKLNQEINKSLSKGKNEIENLFFISNFNKLYFY
jgi:hypothetical protein